MQTWLAAGREATKDPEFVYVRDGQACGPLAPSYSGPYRVLERKDKVVRLQLGDREEWIALERTKAHTGVAPVVPAEPPTRGRPRKAVAAEDSATD